jgi:hypothetical protein
MIKKCLFSNKDAKDSLALSKEEGINSFFEMRKGT